jgi:hypothetical protein
MGKAGNAAGLSNFNGSEPLADTPGRRGLRQLGDPLEYLRQVRTRAAQGARQLVSHRFLEVAAHQVGQSSLIPSAAPITAAHARIAARPVKLMRNEPHRKCRAYGSSFSGNHGTVEIPSCGIHSPRFYLKCRPTESESSVAPPLPRGFFSTFRLGRLSALRTAFGTPTASAILRQAYRNPFSE